MKRDPRLRTLPSRLSSIDVAIVRHAPKKADPELLTPEHRAWRLAVMTRAGWRCEAVDSGYRCAVRHPARLFADHIVERQDGGAPHDPANGQALCGSHHHAKTLAARKARHARRT